MDASSSPDALGIEQIAQSLNEYEILKPLGKGGMGIIFLVRQRLTNRLEVLKVLRPELAARPRLKERFLREVQVAARLDHPNIVKTYTAIDRGFLGLVIEYVPGMDLDSMVRKHGPLRIDQALTIIAQTARGLDHAVSRGLVHRDVKPSNILVSKSAEGLQAKLSDFGLCKDIEFNEADGLTIEGRFLGTPEYVAPEQALDPSNSTVASDIYGLGCSLYFALTGSPPYRGGNTIAVLNAHINQPIPDIRLARPDTPPAVHQLIEWMLRKDSRTRCQSPQQVADQLESLLQGNDYQALPQPSQAAPVVNQADALPPTSLSTLAGSSIRTGSSVRRVNAGRQKKRGIPVAMILQIATPLVLLAAVLWVRPWQGLTGPGTLVLSGIADGITVEVDGRAIDVVGNPTVELPLEPGSHLLRFSRNGRSITETISIKPRQRFEFVASIRGGEPPLRDNAPRAIPPVRSPRQPTVATTSQPSVLKKNNTDIAMNVGEPAESPSSRTEPSSASTPISPPPAVPQSSLPPLAEGREGWMVSHDRTISSHGNTRLAHLTMIPREVAVNGNDLVAALGFRAHAWDTKLGTQVPIDVPMGETKGIFVGANDRTILYFDDYNCNVFGLQKQKPVPLFKSSLDTLTRRTFVLSSDCKSLGCVDAEESFSKYNFALRKQEPVVTCRHPMGSQNIHLLLLSNRLDNTVVCGHDGRMVVWETGEGNVLGDVQTELAAPILSAHLISQTNQVILVTEAGEFEARKMPKLETITRASLVDGAAISSCVGNRVAAIAHANGAVTLIDLLEMKVFDRLASKPGQVIQSLTISRDGKTLAIGYGDTAIAIYGLKRVATAQSSEAVSPIDSKRE